MEERFTHGWKNALFMNEMLSPRWIQDYGGDVVLFPTNGSHPEPLPLTSH
jgi:hypothetical protein